MAEMNGIPKEMVDTVLADQLLLKKRFHAAVGIWSSSRRMNPYSTTSAKTAFTHFAQLKASADISSLSHRQMCL